jgi:hypothetical protein
LVSMVYSTPSYLISLFEIRLILLPMYGALILLGACVSLAREINREARPSEER